jgi:hypothetical protein
MKSIWHFLIVGCTAMLVMSGCGRSNDRANHLHSLYIRVAAFQDTLYPQVPELGKVALQIDSLVKRQDRAIVRIRPDVEAAHELIARAFTTIDGLVTPLPKNDLEVLITDAETKEKVLKSSISEVSQAIKKSHQVIDAVKMAEAQTKRSKR